MKKYLVFDVGGSFIKFALMDSSSIYKKGKVKTPADSLGSFLDAIEQVCRTFEGKIEGVAMSMPGLIDSSTGYAVHGGSLEYVRKLNMADKIQERLQLPVWIENDGKCAALGEVWKGQLKDVQNGIAFVLGTGIGGGIVLNGQLVKGHHFGAGEFSFIRTEGSDPLSIDDFLGHVGSTTRLVRSAALRIGKDPASFSGEDMFREIRRGNKVVKNIFQKYCTIVAGQLMSLQAILDPEVIIIGGGMSAEPMLIEELQRSLYDLQENDFFTKVNGYRTEIKGSELGNDANLYGALYQYLNSDSR
ncbi:ROK family protein [Alkalibacterium olivapovliticus]|uniref:Putative NBD/HSP70 family sugar kinase n=1 Tax=Alkalibacterium olivapovliticus TaxID=99907 RepID=A0A2T0VUG1_9LACT|nr:ROK family protein [Alkalibacterium olivapovliticus]PRY75090.1 putative NBD/HSP70 family sugar kinase [Alkalibacterium olivapovliticus]